MVRLLRVLLSVVWPCGPLLQAVRVEPFVFALRLFVLVIVVVIAPTVIFSTGITIVVTAAATDIMAHGTRNHRRLWESRCRCCVPESLE